MVSQQCFTEGSTGLPGGFCSMTGCVTNVRRDPCPTDTECIALRSTSVCMQECFRTSDCRDGWTCRDDIDWRESVCWLSCTTTGCAEGLICMPSGSCAEPTVPDVD